eukprot:16432968-Heterocapsa_arctica.AAC.1
MGHSETDTGGTEMGHSETLRLGDRHREPATDPRTGGTESDCLYALHHGTGMPCHGTWTTL